MDQGPETNYHFYNRHLQTFSRRLRNRMTKAEACLWKYVLRAGNMKGYEFRRQRPVLNYIADFMCFELNLVIEVDGITHQWDETLEKDIKKESALAKVGITVLRFSDEEILCDIKHVYQRIEWWIEEKERLLQELSSPLPPSKGG